MAPQRTYYDVATRAQVVSLKAFGVTNDQITAKTGVPDRTIRSIFARAQERGFDPNSNLPVVKIEHVADAPRSGRPSKQTEENKEEIIKKIRRDRYGREKSCAQIASEMNNISEITVWRILRTAGFKKTKPTRKPGLTEKMKKARLDFALRYEHWTLEDWKNVIFSDETSVVLNHRRGGYRIWRKSEERIIKSCIRERWKGYSEFMFWGCFSYDKKGLCHIWRPETVKQKKDAQKILDELNEEFEPIKRAEWELTSDIQRLGLRNPPGRKPVWCWNEKNGKLIRKGGNGIDWYRYRAEVLIPKLLPFAKECEKDRPNILVQDDGALAHAHHYQQTIFDFYKVQRLLWCGNSPDLNMIEPCWPYMKRLTTKKGAPKNRIDGERAWQQVWQELEQERIQAWIERIPRHIKEIIRLEGGNEYLEGRKRKGIDIEKGGEESGQ